MASMSDYLNKLVAQKNTLADNLVTKDVTATHDETLETLVPKVLDISGGGTSIAFVGTIKNLCVYNPTNPYLLSGARYTSSIITSNQLINNDNSDFVFAPSNNDWEICIKFNMSSLKNNSALIGCAYSSNYWSTPSIEYMTQNDGLWFGISTNGSSWTFSGTTGSIESGKDYWVKLSYSSIEGYKFLLSENGVNFEVKYETSVTDVQYQNESRSIMQLFNVANSGNHVASTAKIDLRETYVKFGDEIVWGSKSYS